MWKPPRNWFVRVAVLLVAVAFGFVLGVQHERPTNKGFFSLSPQKQQGVLRFDVAPGQGVHKVSVSVFASYSVLAQSSRARSGPYAATPCVAEAMEIELREESADSAYFALSEQRDSIIESVRTCMLDSAGTSVGDFELQLIRVDNRGIFMPRSDLPRVDRLTGI